MFEEIKNEFYSTVLVNEVYLYRSLQSNKALKTKIENTEIGDAENYKEKVWMLLNKIWEVPLCECGNKRKLKNLKEGFRDYCSNYCANNSQKKISKIKEINLERYGVEVPIQNPAIKSKIEETNLNRYGVKNAYQVKEVVNNIQTQMCNQYIENVLPKRIEDLAKLKIFPNEWENDQYTGAKNLYSFIHQDCGRIFNAKLENGGIPLCPYCHTFRSEIELRLVNELEPIFPQLQKSNRKLIHPYEIDIVINDIGIEINGIYWHSVYMEDIGKKLPLLEKTTRCPIQLLHFWETELYTKFEICKSIICAKLGRSEHRILAEQCEIRELSMLEAKVFFNENHLRGHNDNTSYYLGLLYQEEIVQALSISETICNEDYDIELQQLTSKLNIEVIGGANMLFAQLKRDFNGQNMISYVDKRFSKGTTLKHLGFEELQESKPNLFWASRNMILSLRQCQHENLLTIFGNKVDFNLSEAENMKKLGFYQIRDCGEKIFTIHL